VPQLTLVHTDIQGSTRLWDRLGHSFADVLADHNRILREAIAAHAGGSWRPKGLVHDLVPDGRRRRSVRTRGSGGASRPPWPSDAGEILVRMGIHTGEAVVQGGAVAGPVPGRCRLIAGAGHGGQILLSEAARAAAGRFPLRAARGHGSAEHRSRRRPLEHLVQALPLSLAGRAFRLCAR